MDKMLVLTFKESYFVVLAILFKLIADNVELDRELDLLPRREMREGQGPEFLGFFLEPLEKVINDSFVNVSTTINLYVTSALEGAKIDLLNLLEEVLIPGIALSKWQRKIQTVKIVGAHLQELTFGSIQIHWF